MRHDDHNQSSRLDLDLDWDYNASGTDFDASAASPLNPLGEIAEGEDDYSSSEDEKGSGNASFSASKSSDDEDRHRRRRQQQQDYDYDDDGAVRPRDAGGGGGRRRQQPQQQQERDRHRPSRRHDHETNGHGSRNGTPDDGYNFERGATPTTMSRSTEGSSRRRDDGTTSAVTKATRNRGRKMVAIKLWDPGDASSSSDPTYVTVAMDVLTRRGLGDALDMSLGAGQKIQFRRKKDRDRDRKDSRGKGGGASSGDDQEVEIVTWQPPRPREEEAESSWRPPFALSDEDRARRAEIQNSVTILDNQRNRPQPQSAMPAEERETTPPRTRDARFSGISAPTSEMATDRASTPPLSSIPKTSEAYKKSPTATENNNADENDTGALPAPPVRGLEPFTIPSVLSCTVIKRTPTEKVGLAFRKATGTVVIEKIVPGSAFDGTALRPGHECLSINGRRLRSARRAAEIVRESGEGLTLVASDAPRPPGTMYTMISLEGHDLRGGSSSRRGGGDATTVAGMRFRMKHGLVQLERADVGSPIHTTSMRAGDYVLAFNGNVVGSALGAVEVLESEANAVASPDAVDFGSGATPVLYFNMRQLRVSLVDKVIGDLWKKEWSDTYDKCIVQGGGGGSVSSNSNSEPLTLRFEEEKGMCELVIDNPHNDDDFSDAPPTKVPSDHPLHSVVETLNHGIACVLSAIRQGVELQAAAANKSGSSTDRGMSPKDGDYDEYDDARNRNGEHGDFNNNKASDVGATGGGGIMAELARLSGMYREGLLSRDDFETIKSELLAGSRSNDDAGRSNGNVDRGGRRRLSDDNRDFAVGEFFATKNFYRDT